MRGQGLCVSPKTGDRSRVATKGRGEASKLGGTLFRRILIGYGHPHYNLVSMVESGVSNLPALRNSGLYLLKLDIRRLKCQGQGHATSNQSNIAPLLHSVPLALFDSPAPVHCGQDGDATSGY